MKRFICMFFAVIMCLGFLGCKKDESSSPAEPEKATPQVEETIAPVETRPAPEEIIPPVETPPAPVEKQPQGEQ